MSDPTDIDELGPSPQEIDDFIKDNDVDDRAAADLRDCPPDVQSKVLARGDLRSARNPSAALLVRIRDGRVGHSGSSFSSGVGLPSSADIEDYIKASSVEGSHAADTLRSASPTVKRRILASGPLQPSHDPPAALMLRIRDAKAGGGAGMHGMGFAAVNAPSPQEIDDFIRMNDVDDRAAADLRDSPPNIQQAVIARGELRSARNPSSVLLARIRDAKLGASGGGMQGMQGMQAMGQMPMGYPPMGYPPMGYPPMGMYPGYGYPPMGYPPGYPASYPYAMPGAYPPQAGYPAGPGGAQGSEPGGRNKQKDGRARSASGSSSYSYSASSRSRSRPPRRATRGTRNGRR